MLGTRTAVLVVALVLAASCGQVERIARDVGLVNTPMDPPAGGVEWFTRYGAGPIELEDGSRWTIEVPMGAMADNDWMRANGYFDSIPDPVSVVNPDGTVGELAAGSRLVAEPPESGVVVLPAGSQIVLAGGFVPPGGGALVGVCEDSGCTTITD